MAFCFGIKESVVDTIYCLIISLVSIVLLFNGGKLHAGQSLQLRHLWSITNTIMQERCYGPVSLIFDNYSLVDDHDGVATGLGEHQGYHDLFVLCSETLG